MSDNSEQEIPLSGFLTAIVEGLTKTIGNLGKKISNEWEVDNTTRWYRTHGRASRTYVRNVIEVESIQFRNNASGARRTMEFLFHNQIVFYCCQSGHIHVIEDPDTMGSAERLSDHDYVLVYYDGVNKVVQVLNEKSFQFNFTTKNPMYPKPGEVSVPADSEDIQESEAPEPDDDQNKTTEQISDGIFCDEV